MQTEMTQDQAAGARSERSERSAPAGGIVEIPAVVRRRQFTTEYKLRILDELDHGTPGQGAAVARREGLYSSTLFNWKAWRERMQAQGNGDVVPKGATEREGLRQQLRKLERENQQLRLKLARAEGLIELQKKASALLESLSQTDAPGGSS